MEKSKLQIKLDELKAAHPDATVETLFEALAKATLSEEEKDASIATLKGEKETLEQDVEGLNKDLAEFESGKKTAPEFKTVTVAKEDYLVKRGINIKGTAYTAEQIAENKIEIAGIPIANHMVKIQSGVLSLKPKEVK